MDPSEPTAAVPPYPEFLSKTYEGEPVLSTEFSHEGWSFHTVTEPILHTHELEQGQAYLNKKLTADLHVNSQKEKLSQQIDGAKLVQSMPEMFYGRNMLVLTCSKQSLALTFSPFDSLAECVNKQRQQSLARGVTDLKISQIDMVPKEVGVIGSSEWSHKDTSQIQDYKPIEKNMDWSFCTPYKGHLVRLADKKQAEGVLLSMNQAQIDSLVASASPQPFKVITEGAAAIPLELLGPQNHVLHYGEVILYEDELADRGCSKSYVRYRVMKDCWFILLRSYLRLDKVAVRILDTRIFHKFGSNRIIRDFIHKEEDWTSLSQKTVLDSQWLLSPSQSDEVYEHLSERKVFKDEIEF